MIMANGLSPSMSLAGDGSGDEHLLLRETYHRCSNDLQLIVSLLALQSRRAAHPEVRHALADAVQRVSILARARSAMQTDRPPTLETALRQVCEALHSQADPHAILISLEATDAVQGLPATKITTLALVVNELATNAIKHGFRDGKAGRVRISIHMKNSCKVIVLVDDDGLPFPKACSDGLGLAIAQRLMLSIGGSFIMPRSGSKTFELRVPVG